MGERRDADAQGEDRADELVRGDRRGEKNSRHREGDAAPRAQPARSSPARAGAEAGGENARVDAAIDDPGPYGHRADRPERRDEPADDGAGRRADRSVQTAS